MPAWKLSRTDLRYSVMLPAEDYPDGIQGEAGRTRAACFGGLRVIDVALGLARRAQVGSVITLRLWDGGTRDLVYRYRVTSTAWPSVVHVERDAKPKAPSWDDPAPLTTREAEEYTREDDLARLLQCSKPTARSMLRAGVTLSAERAAGLTPRDLDIAAQLGILKE